MFPIGDDQVKGGFYPYFSYFFIALNILVFLYEFSMPIAALEQFFVKFGSIPSEIIVGADTFTLLTSLFLHGGWMHLGGNMLHLWVFADNIEATIGNIPFLFFYIIGGVLASVTHVVLFPESNIPLVGASGAISAVMGAYFVLFPFSKIKVWVFLFSFRIIALIFLGFWIISQTFSGTAALAPSVAESAGVAFWAHIGGFAFGVIMGVFFRFKYHPVRLDRTAIEH